MNGVTAESQKRDVQATSLAFGGMCFALSPSAELEHVLKWREKRHYKQITR